MEIRTVTETEITAAGKIYTACSHAMNQKGLFNWTPEYPTQKEAERDQRAGALYGAFDRSTPLSPGGFRAEQRYISTV